MSNAYQEGIAARKDGKGRHENPYEGVTVSFTAFLFCPTIFSPDNNPVYKKIEWDKGWYAEDSWKRKIG